LKPYTDWLTRHKISNIVIWQQQKRGSWHPHVVVNKYVDVNWARAWMMKRGWGPQMRFEPICYKRVVNGGAWIEVTSDNRLVNYLCRLIGYLVRDVDGQVASKVKTFQVSRVARVGTVTCDGKTAWNWVPWEKAGSYLYSKGRSLFFELHGVVPTFRDIGYIIRLGVEETGWANIDFLWEFGFPSG